MLKELKLMLNRITFYICFVHFTRETLGWRFCKVFNGGREGQAPMNPVERVSEKRHKMCYSGGNFIYSPFISTYGTGSQKY